MQDVQQDVTKQFSHNVLIPISHISVSVDIGFESEELGNIGISDVGKKENIEH